MSYRKIMLCVDNSSFSMDATRQSARIADAFDSKVVGVHVYAASMHFQRFIDLEPTLPEEYQGPEKLAEMRDAHDSLIADGLHMISESYVRAVRSELNGVDFEPKNIDGTNYTELLKESRDEYDLAVLGARGMGLAATNGMCPPDALGTVCQRFMRGAETDVLIVRDNAPPDGTILVAVDGSSESYGALRKAIGIAKATGAKVEATTCFDPDFHPVVFDAIVDVLSEKDAEFFNFEEQEELHNTIINQGLAHFYQGYLEKAKIVAQGKGFEIETKLLEGRPAFEVAKRAGEMNASLVVVSRYGRHQTGEVDIGATSETIVKMVPGNVLIINEKFNEEDIPEHEQSLEWTQEAEDRLIRVPGFMRPIVRKAIENYARTNGHEVVTAEVVGKAKTSHGVPMPGHAEDDE